LPQHPRLRALAAATLAALVIVTIQPPAPGAAEMPTPTARSASVAPAAVEPPVATAAPTAAPVAALTVVESPAVVVPPAVVEPPAAVVPPAAPAPAAPSAPKRARTASRADRVIAAAMAERGSPWVYGATGPRTFDCSGLVIYAFRRSGVLAEIGSGRYHSGGAMLRWARAHRLTRLIGRRGDVVVWGNGAHVGIYLGKGKAISTLTSGVRVHGLRVLNTRFTTFISTGLSTPVRAVGAGDATTATKPTTVATAATALVAARAKVIGLRTVTAARLNLRAAPRLTADASRILARGTGLGVLRSAKDGAGRTWYRVVVGARIGWVAGWLTRPAR
jgi:cell wall-associated NlpC family hydrolase